MSEQALDLRSTWAVARRHTRTLVIAAALGTFAAGAALSVKPPEYSSTSKVLLPAATLGSVAAATAHSIDTQVQIAESEAVLGPAGKAMSPPLTVRQVARRVEVKGATSELMVITAKGTTPGQALALADAVARAEINYLKSAADTVAAEGRKAQTERLDTLKEGLAAVNAEITKTQTRLDGEAVTTPAGKADAGALAALTAQQANLVLQIDKVGKEAGSQPAGEVGVGATLIEQASLGTGTSTIASYALFEAVGAGAGIFVALLLLTLKGRRERAVRSRDQIADAIGVPVVASIQSRFPRSVAGWTSLLKSYAPANVESWTLRQLLRLVTPGHPGSLADEPSEDSESPSVAVLTLSGDLRALAVGPQLASFAASTGLRTCLRTAQMHESANALWAACSGIAPDEQLRSGLWVGSSNHIRDSADLVVHIAVIDRQRPHLRLDSPGTVTLLAVTAGAATAEDLARVALAADDSDNPIARIIVVDPDPLDRTTGRLLPFERAAQVPLPSLMTGTAIAAETSSLATRRRLR